MEDIRQRRLAAVVVALLAVVAIAPGSVVADGLAVDDPNYSTAEDTSLFVAPEEGVLANDIGGSLALCVVSFDPTGLQGSLDTSSPDGSFTYTPSANFNGSTTFTYSVATKTVDSCPSLSEGSATVTITVTPVNDPPAAHNDSFSGLAGKTLTIAAPGVLGNDSDIDRDPLTAVQETGPTHGALKLAANGGFSYTPNAGYVGSDAFSYHAFDGTEASATRVVALSITALPPTRAPTPGPSTSPTGSIPSGSPEPSPSESPLPSDSGPPSPSPSDSGLAGASFSQTPTVGGLPEPAGIPIVAIGALGLLIGLLTVAAVFFVQSQRGAAPSADEGGALRPDEQGEPYEPDEPDDVDLDDEV